MKSLDPTKTTGLQKRFERQVRSDVNSLANEISKWFDDPNNWIHESLTDEIDTNAAGDSRWSLAPRGQVLGAFTRWIGKLLGTGKIEKTSDGFVSEAFEAGVKHANTFAAVEVAPAVSGVFRTGTTIERLKVLRAQARNTITGLKEKIKRSVIDRLSLGLIRGESPRQVAADLAKTTKGLGKTSALRIARTEVIRSHAEGALDRMEAMGVTHVGAEVEFSATRLLDGSFEKRVCPKCRALDGVVFPIASAHGIIPVHVNCRCTWLPSFEKVDKDKIRKAVSKAVKSSLPKKPSKKSQTSDADLSTAANQPAKPAKPAWPGPAITEYLKE